MFMPGRADALAERHLPHAGQVHNHWVIMHKAQVRRYEPMCGLANRLLWVDLTEQEVRSVPVGEYVPDYPGGRG